MTLRAEDGSPLDVKEGTVLDSEGNALSGPGPHQRYGESPFGGGTGRAFVWKSAGLPTSPLAWLVLIPLLAVLLFIGITFFAIVAAFALVLMVVFVVHRWLRRVLGGR
jgi:hypothetical protein